MPDPNCVDCHGLGYTVRDDGEAITCRCTVIEQIAKSIKATPGLEGVERLGRGLVDFSGGQPVPLRGSALVRCHWSPMLEHVAGWIFANIRRGRNPKVHITSCSRLRGLYFGGDEGKSKSSKLSRLEPYDLVVVNLMAIKNAATQEALLEAIDYASMIWIVYPPGATFQKGHPAWSPRIDELLDGVQRIDLTRYDGRPKGGVLAKIGLGPTRGGHDG